MRILSGNIFNKICTAERNVSPTVLKYVLDLCVELAREGREGRKIGTLFTVGDEEQVLKYSRCLILDPLLGHPDNLKKIDNAAMRETVKELAQLDGAFIVSEQGVILSAARYLEAPSEKVKLPLGLGARHVAAAAMSLNTRAVSVVVSSSSIILVFENGEIIAEIFIELRGFGRESIYIKDAKIKEFRNDQLTVVTKDEKFK